MSTGRMKATAHREMSDVELAYYYEDKSGSLVVDPESDKTPFLKF